VLFPSGSRPVQDDAEAERRLASAKRERPPPAAAPLASKRRAAALEDDSVDGGGGLEARGRPLREGRRAGGRMRGPAVRWM